MVHQLDLMARDRDTAHQWGHLMRAMEHRRECPQVRQGPWLARLPVLCLVRHPVAEEQAGWVVLVAGKPVNWDWKENNPFTRKAAANMAAAFSLRNLFICANRIGNNMARVSKEETQ